MYLFHVICRHSKNQNYGNIQPKEYLMNIRSQLFIHKVTIDTLQLLQ